jgi:hypothetical protein
VTSLIQWDVRASRRWTPLYSLNYDRFDSDPIPPVTVEINAAFDNDQAARIFEQQVRKLLEGIVNVR